MKFSKLKFIPNVITSSKHRLSLASLVVLSGAVTATDLPNACPVDGCTVRIIEATLENNEVAVQLEANFQPDMAKNHLHIWWGDSFSFMQVSGNAETEHNVTQGTWHPTDIYPNYTTQGAVSVENREGSNNLCVGAADRNHDVIDVNVYHCVDISSLF